MRSSTVTEEPKERTRNLWRAVAVGVSALAIATLSVGLSAQEADDLLGPFTPGKWQLGRRTAPSPQEVLRLSLLSAGTTWPGSASSATDSSPGRTFYRTEGVQKAGTFGDAVQVDLYLDPAWENNATRAGVWVFDPVAFAAGLDPAYGIIEFANLRPPGR